MKLGERGDYDGFSRVQQTRWLAQFAHAVLSPAAAAACRCETRWEVEAKVEEEEAAGGAQERGRVNECLTCDRKSAPNDYRRNNSL